MRFANAFKLLYRFPMPMQRPGPLYRPHSTTAIAYTLFRDLKTFGQFQKCSYVYLRKRNGFNLGTLRRNDTSATPVWDLFGGGIP